MKLRWEGERSGDVGLSRGRNRRKEILYSLDYSERESKVSLDVHAWYKDESDDMKEMSDTINESTFLSFSNNVEQLEHAYQCYVSVYCCFKPQTVKEIERCNVGWSRKNII